jgi:phospholipid/cholesterol/gamma-HCH transport system permease protein
MDKPAGTQYRGFFSASLEGLGLWLNGVLTELGEVLLLLGQAAAWTFRPPLRLSLIFKQMEFVGVKSIWVVSLTGAFTGGVLALQTYHGFVMFNAESLVGATVALSMTRELGPVLTCLMITARAGSAMAAELGSMKVSEQVDALSVMAINPVKYLVVPRMLAGITMAPILTVISDFIGVVGGYFVGVYLLQINRGVFMSNLVEMVALSDIFNGLAKSVCFGLFLTLISCYKGITTTGGAEGVGRATTRAVVYSSVTILVSDYFLTALMF